MSQTYYQELWQQAQDELKKQLSLEAKLKKKGPFKDFNAAKWLVGHLFMNYVGVVNRLDQCYDQMLHPQKREVISRLLDMSLGRLLELKAEMVRIECDDYCFFDNVLLELKLTHRDMEIRVPKYFSRDREKAKEHRRALIKQVFAEAEREKFKEEYLRKIPEESREEEWNRYLVKEEQLRLEQEKFEEQQRKMMAGAAEEKDSLEKLKKELREKEEEKREPPRDEALVWAVSLIQRHERARQGRFQAGVAKRNKILKALGERGVRPMDEEAAAAAKVIQRHWRRHRARRKAAKAVEILGRLLGEEDSSFKDRSKRLQLENAETVRRKMQERNQREYEEALVRVKEKVTARYTIPMEEDIVDEIRAWFRWHFDKSNYLPDYPPEKQLIPTGDILGVPKKLGPNFAETAFPQPKSKMKTKEPLQSTSLGIALSGMTAIGGTALVVAGHWIGPLEFLICQKELEKRKKAGKGNDAKGPKEDKKAMLKKMKELERKKQLAEDALGFKLRDSNYVVPLKKADRDYRLTWMDMDESKNYEQRYIYDFVKDEKCWELSMEVRRAVDEMMVLELDILKEALERDKNPKKKPKKKKPKKPKKEKKKKQKKDPTGDRTLDDLFMELFRNGIIKDYEEARLEDYLGERSFAAFDLRQRLVDWPPSSGDVRELILQLCVLPLGSWRIHQISPLVKSVCLMGMQNSGKEFLARIICTETAAVMFDLTPENVVGKYPGKDGLKMLQHLIEKMSRALQPSVIFVDGAEKTFYKKVPKEEKEFDPKRMAGLLSKLVKGIKPPDQVLAVGVCSRPWMARKPKLLKTYQKIIFVPEMDYGSYVRLWQALLAPYHSVPRDFDVSCLARVSRGFSVKAIMDAVRNVLTAERVSRSRFHPYQQMEFLEELLKTPRVDEKSREKCLKFYAGTEMPKKRQKRLEEIRQELEKAKKKT